MILSRTLPLGRHIQSCTIVSNLAINCGRNNTVFNPRRSLHESKPDEDTTTTDVVARNKYNEILEKEFPNFYSNGKYVDRITYVDFIDQALARLKALGLDKDIEAYKEILRIFPQGKYHPKSKWDFGLHHAPQQLAAIRLLHQLERSGIKPDKDIERLVIRAFSKRSDVWLKIARLNYWTMKGRNWDPDPLPEQLPKKPHELAKVALTRMLVDNESIIYTTKTSQIAESRDKTWVVYAQSPVQQELIERLDDKVILYLEDGGVSFVRSDYLSYFVLRTYDSEEVMKARPPEPPMYGGVNYNTLKMGFFGRPIAEKMLEQYEQHHVGDGHILAIGYTGTSSPDSASSWLKILQKRNPKLANMSVVFRLKQADQEESAEHIDDRDAQDANRQ